MKKFLMYQLFFLIFFMGCATSPLLLTPIVTGVIYWKEGEARKYYAESSSLIHRATVLALQDLNHEIISDDKNTDGSYTISAGNDDKFKIKIKMVKPEISEVRIRVNFMGDKPYAELIYKMIDAHTSTIEYDQNGIPTKVKN
jgi:hypothetical protein